MFSVTSPGTATRSPVILYSLNSTSTVVDFAVEAVPGSFHTATAPIAAIGIEMTANSAITATKYHRVRLSSVAVLVGEGMGSTIAHSTDGK